MVTRLIAIRHARPLSEGYAEDRLRPLSDIGKVEQNRVLQKLKEKGYKADVVFTSPLVRAVQTAELVAEVLGGKVVEEEALGEIFDSEQLLKRIEKGQTVVFVGHAPTLAEFVNALAGETAITGLTKSAAAIVDFEGDIGYYKGGFVEYVAH